MSWIGLLLIGVGITDLVFSVRPMRRVPEAVGATVLVLAGLAAGPERWVDALAVAVLALLVLAWGHTVTRGFASGPAWVPLAVLGGSLLLALAVSPAATPAQGLLGRWLAATPFPPLSGLDADTALVLLGVLLVQLSTGNVVVRLVLSATGTVDPARPRGRDVPSYRLKGGRLLGPMERVFILGLGIAGQLTAAAIVVAAKGLLRWPELQAARDEDPTGTGLHQVTEYFLVGSFVSWLVALGSLALLG
jgi:hypothetical protein